MDHDALHIREALLDRLFRGMGDEVSGSHRDLTIHEQVEIDDPIESTLASDADIYIFDICIFSEECTDRPLELRIIDFIEEFSHRGPPDVIDIIAHEEARDDGGIVCSLEKYFSRKQGKQRSDEGDPSRDGIREVMERITDDRG